MDDHSVDALSALLESLEIGFLALPKIRYSGFVTRIGSGSVLLIGKTNVQKRGESMRS